MKAKDYYMQKIQDAEQEHTYTCNCGHRLIILPKQEKRLCSWCHNYVFKNKNDEFRYRLKEKIRRCK